MGLENVGSYGTSEGRKNGASMCFNLQEEIRGCVLGWLCFSDIPIVGEVSSEGCDFVKQGLRDLVLLRTVLYARGESDV